MTCQDAERLIHLYRDGERTASEEERLQRHLRTCPACRELAAEVRGDLAPVEAARDEGGVPDPDPALTDRIMAGVRALDQDGGRSIRSGRWGGSWRVLATAAAAVLFLLLGAQELVTLGRLAVLEERVASVPVGGREAGALQGAVLAGSRGTAFGDRAPSWMVVERGELTRTFRKLGVEAELVPILLDGLAARFPDLDGIDASDGLDSGEIGRLLRHRDEILSALKAL